MNRLVSPRVYTALVTTAFAAATTVLALRVGSRALVLGNPPALVVGLALVAMFVIGEVFLMNVEFRRHAYSLTLAGVPLAVGLLMAPPLWVLGARLIGTGIAVLIQRVSPDKICYNLAGYSFETVADVVLIHALLGTGFSVDLHSVLILMVVLAAVDQFMSLLVINIIRLHQGSFTRKDVLDVLLPAFVLSLVASALALVVVLLLRHGVIGAGLVCMLVAVSLAAYRSQVITRRRHRSLTLVHEFVSDGVGAPSMEALAEQLLGRIRRLLRAAQVELLIVDGHRQGGAGGPRRRAEDTSKLARPVMSLTLGEDDQLTVRTSELDKADWILVRALTQDEPLLIPRTTKDRGLRKWLTDRDLRDAVVVGMPATTGVEGALLVTDRLGETATFTDEDVTLLETLTGHLAVAVRGTRLLEALSYDATHDSLTGLFNRAHLTSRLAESLAGSTDVAVLLLDLNRFKDVNDALGHDVGDRLLAVVAQRLRGCLPAQATVARLGGDEFAVLIPDLVGGRSAAGELAGTVAAQIAQPVRFEEAMLTPETSIGVAVRLAGQTDTDMLRQADTAMYEAKGSGVSVALYTLEMDQGRLERLALLADLRHALTSAPEQLVMNYQPKVDLHTGRVVSAEALVRWHHPTLGIVGPDRFVPLAETSGLIELLTPLVLDAALAECRAWAGAGMPISVAVNLSARNLSDPSLVQRVAQALKRAEVEPQQLILEITESSVMGDPAQTLPVLHELRALGVCLSLDDFGTGYSSLSYLQKMPVGEVKIDKSFVMGLDGDTATSSRALIRSITGLGTNLGLRVVAEGVEDAATMQLLRELGCDVAQGYHISRPINGQQMRTWLATEQADNSPRLRLLTANG